MLDHADYTAPTRQHKLDHTDHTRSVIDLPCLEDLDHNVGIDHTDHTDHLSEVWNEAINQQINETCNQSIKQPLIALPCRRRWKS